VHSGYLPRVRRTYRDADARCVSLKCRTGGGVGVERGELTKRRKPAMAQHSGSKQGYGDGGNEGVLAPSSKLEISHPTEVLFDLES